MKNYRAIGLVFTFTALSSLSAFAASLPGGASTLQETYQDWTVSCQSQKDTTACVMRQEQSSAQTGQRVLTAELRNVAGGKVDGVLLMPFGLDLAKGASLKIDDTAGPNLTFSTCLPQGCLAPVSFDCQAGCCAEIRHQHQCHHDGAQPEPAGCLQDFPERLRCRARPHSGIDQVKTTRAPV
ncbi:hypothetical protein IY71_01790 [Brucella suis]|uniref:Invasion associated locus B family protein n=1 Tax=Brucella suis TaxID=29461 RepID=A0AAU8QV33_BRUSS|nr:hypothetical protein IY71_01790 [Brucella suis]ALY30935.1 hypothetical protein AWH03_02630 [Brucella suis 019]ENR24273.1 hypothetical protein C062_00188 [Brucella suis 92/29]ENR30717.1 hypothetical protein C965_00190 [Brucella suis CNGB 786]ENT30519.1 hypothetical protein B985_00069 [Brucella suis 01-5744]ENT37233.1 hypothetical protein C966_00189 [Brucella suis CNGB 247]KDV06330.1 hypothetical protein BF16_09080 [Brucella suis 1330]